MEALTTLVAQSGFAGLSWQNLVMFVVGGVLIFLAIRKGYEPLLLIPIGIGAILANLPNAMMSASADWVAVTGGSHPLLQLIYDAGIKTELLADNSISLPGAIEKALYGIAQESLNNILKHAEATRIRVELRQSEGSAALEITDNGLGFDTVVARQRGGLGLLGLEERAAAIGGLLFIDSHPGSGTLIRVEVPLKNLPPAQGGSPGVAS